jgi:probable phosphoglycerate mutase
MVSQSKVKNSQLCTIYIIRHGETEWNLQEKLQGHKDSPLTQNGVEQAKKRAKDLAQIAFAEIFSSDLLRAKRTAEIIALEHKMVVKTTELLRERNYGGYEGRKVSEYREELKDMLQKRETLSEKDKFAFKLQPDIESDEEIVTRMITFLREVALAYKGKTIGLVCHGSIMRSFLVHIGFGTSSEMTQGAVGNLAYFVLETDGVDFFVKETDGVVKVK